MQRASSRRKDPSRPATTSAAPRLRRYARPSRERDPDWPRLAAASADSMDRGMLKQIGKYPVLRKLGEGATSEVYLCTDSFNRRDVAVKVAFPETFQDPEKGRLYRKLFLTEASLAGKLQHPHICEIFDAVADEGLHYLVMEYVD